MKDLWTRIFMLSTLLLLAVLASCGAGGGSAVSALEAQQEPQPAPSAGPQLTHALPRLDALPAPARIAALAGPGFHQVPILEQGVVLDRFGDAVLGPEGIELDGGSSEAWVLIGVHGFDGDSQPHSVMPELSALSGDCHIGVSRYLSGRWEWSTALQDGDEFSYPDVSPITVADQYVSDRSYHYIVVLVPTGSSATLSGLQLGVYGGDNAPEAPQYFEASNGDGGLHFWWYPSPDHNDPDFCGYVMERALWPGTDYTDLGALSQDTFFHDGTADPALKYRYRLRVEDISGNFSHGQSSTLFSFSGDNPPVPALDMPAGPLYGAQVVSFDLSGSYDPNGDPITEYTLSFDNNNGISGVAPVVSTDPEISVLLQPGCYVVQASAKSVSYSQPIRDTLRIYPVWQQGPELVATPGSGQWRMQRNRSIYWPQQDAMVTFFHDYLGPGLGALLQHSDGSHEFMQVPYLLYGIDWISEPVIWHGRPWVAIVSDSAMLLASIGPDGLQWTGDSLGYTSFDNIDLVVDGADQLRVCVLNEYNPGDFEILAINSESPLDHYTLEAMSNSDGPFDVEWNPVLGGFELVFTTVGSLHWNRTDEEGGLVDDAFVGAGIFDSVDMELHADGSPAVMGPAGGFFTFFSYDETGGSWSVPEVIDISGANAKSGDLLFDGDDMAAFFGLVLGQSSLYRRDGGSWTPQTVDWALLSGQHCAVAQWPDGRVNVIDGTVGGALFISDFSADGSHSAPLEIPSVSWDGIDLNAVAGADGIHAVWRGDNGAVHYIADDSGDNWTASAGFVTSDALDLMADRNGKVFVGNTHGATADLFSWFGGAWLIEGSSNRWGDSLPWLSAQSNVAGGQFFVHDNLPVPPVLQHMHDDGGGFLVFDSYDFDTIRVDEGVSLGYGGSLISFVRGDEILGASGLIGFISADDHTYAHQFQGDNYFGSVDLTRGRRMDACNYLTRQAHLDSAFWTSGTTSDGPGCTRFAGQVINGRFSLDATTPLMDPLVAGAGQNLHTVSAAQAWGLTAVALGDQLRQGHAWLEWSNFGDFEELPLPPLDMTATCMHELVVGKDGRWHILYRDKRDGAIRMISTT